MTRKTKTKDIPEATLLKEGEPAAVPAAQDNKTVALAQADPIFAIIERLAKDPTFDVDKMERLINMHDRAKAGQAQAEFDQAMSAAQAEMMAIRASSKSDKGKYANYATLDKAIRPIYTKHGFSVSFDTDPAAPELTVRLIATVAHRGGHRERRQLDVPADGKGAKGGDVMTRTHATASAVTYGKRYLSSMIWNLAVDHDDDGRAAAGERAKAWADDTIRHLNTANLDKDGLAKWTTDNEKAIAWMKKNAPEEFERYQTAYSNAAEAAGIKKEEPKRTSKKSSEKEAPAAKSSAKITDVVDENAKAPDEPITFEAYSTARAFFDFSDEWLAAPERTPAQAKLWEEFYREKIKEMMTHEYERVRVAMTDTLDIFHKVVGKEQPA